MKYNLSLILLFICLRTFSQLDNKTERKIRMLEDSIKKVDKTFRMVKRVKYGLLGTFTQGSHSAVGIGINRLVTGSVGHWGVQLNYEKILDNRFQGLNLGFYGAAQSSGIFNHLCLGINGGVYSDLSLNFVCVKPEIGFEYLHFILTYSYIWSVPSENKAFQNTHSVNFKYYLTFYRKKLRLLYDF